MMSFCYSIARIQQTMALDPNLANACFVNKVVPQLPLYSPVAYAWFCTIGTELSSCNRLYGLQNLKYLLSGLIPKYSHPVEGKQSPDHISGVEITGLGVGVVAQLVKPVVEMPTSHF